MTKEEIYQEATRKEIGSNPNGTRMGVIYRAMDMYAKQEAIDFNNWLKDNHYTKHPEKGWYKYHENRQDFPSGFSMMSPVYEFITEDEIYNLYLQSKNK